jgi:hypothetical protein
VNRVPKPPQQQPQPSLLNPNWRYVPSASTNVLQRFKALGWVPPSEQKNATTR